MGTPDSRVTWETHAESLATVLPCLNTGCTLLPTPTHTLMSCHQSTDVRGQFPGLRGHSHEPAGTLPRGQGRGRGQEGLHSPRSRGLAPETLPCHVGTPEPHSREPRAPARVPPWHRTPREIKPSHPCLASAHAPLIICRNGVPHLCTDFSAYFEVEGMRQDWGLALSPSFSGPGDRPKVRATAREGQTWDPEAIAAQPLSSGHHGPHTSSKPVEPTASPGHPPLFLLPGKGTIHPVPPSQKHKPPETSSSSPSKPLQAPMRPPPSCRPQSTKPAVAPSSLPPGPAPQFWQLGPPTPLSCPLSEECSRRGLGARDPGLAPPCGRCVNSGKLSKLSGPQLTHL